MLMFEYDDIIVAVYMLITVQRFYLSYLCIFAVMLNNLMTWNEKAILSKADIPNNFPFIVNSESVWCNNDNRRKHG